MILNSMRDVFNHSFSYQLSDLNKSFNTSLGVLAFVVNGECRVIANFPGISQLLESSGFRHNLLLHVPTDKSLQSKPQWRKLRKSLRRSV